MEVALQSLLGIPASPAFEKAFRANVLRKPFAAGSYLAQENDACRYLPLVERGSIRVFKTSPSGREITLYHIERGESCILTANCLLGDRRFPASARTEERSIVILVPVREFRLWMDQEKPWRDYIFENVNRRIVDLLSTMTEVAFGSLPSRLAELLLRTLSRAAAGNSPNTIQVTHQELADELGSAREAVSRLLKEFERRGWVQLGRGRIVLLNAAMLEDVGQGRSL